MMVKSGLIGRGILASRSPWLHEQEARAQHLDLHYQLFDFTDRRWPDNSLAELLGALQDEGYAGFNVTFPFKQAVMPLLDELSESAQLVGAVNTVSISDRRLIGHNTDMLGFQEGLREGLPGVAVNRVLQLGAGGAGAAVAYALLDAGVGELQIVDIDPAKAQQLAERLSRSFGPGRASIGNSSELRTEKVDGIVNTTPVGMASNLGMPIAAELIRPAHWVADIIYFPQETELLRQAQDIGCRTLDGSGMVITQAALAFEIITGVAADKARMKSSFLVSSTLS